MAIDFPSSPTNGQEFSSGSVTWVYDGTAWNLKSTAATTNDSMPIGAIMWFANTTTTPPGWLAADGTNVSRTTYAALFAVIGTTYGSGDGSTTFGLPNISATTGKYYVRYTTAVGTTTTTSLSTAPVGTMLDWPTTSSYPTGYLRANGDAVSRTSYADLFALIGTTYGVGDNSTTFNLPNLPAAGTGSPVKIIKASLGGIVEPSTVAHAASHTQGGSDVISVTLNQVPNYQSYRNVIINGNFNVWQRGTSFSPTTTSTFTADRFYGYRGSLVTGMDVSRQAAGLTGFQYCCRVQRTSGNTNTNTMEFIQDVESSNSIPFAGKSITLSFYGRAGSNISNATLVSRIDTGTGTDQAIRSGYTGVTNNSQNNTLTSSWQRFTHTIVMPSNATQVGIDFRWTPSGTAGVNDYYEITGVQLEAGDVATPFEFEPFNTTFSKCQRYFCKSTPITQTNFTALSADSNMNSGAWWCVSGVNGGGVRVPFPVEMRTVPTVDFTAWTSTNTNVANGGAMTMHAPNLGDVGGVLEYKSQTGLSIYTTTTTSYRMFFFWRANAEL